MLIGLKKSVRLRSSRLIQRGIYPATLYYTPQVKVCLAVADDVYFFSVQFVINL